MNVDDLQRFPLAFIRIHWGHPLDARWEDYEMRKGLTRKPQRELPRPAIQPRSTKAFYRNPACSQLGQSPFGQLFLEIGPYNPRERRQQR
jgi:hypothetical protein